MNFRKNKGTGKLTMMLGLGGLNGSVALAAMQGLFRFENVFSIAVLFMAGPGAIITAALFEGDVRQRMFVALISGILATIIVMLSAGIGPKLLFFVNIDILKIFGGIAVLAIGFLIMGVKMNEHIPTAIMLLGLVAAIIWK